MRQLCLLWTVLISLLAMSSCSQYTANYQPHVDHQLLKASWLPYINTDPTKWTAHADRWYFTGEPNITERDASSAPYDDATTIMAVRVPNFTQLNIDGSFQVQIIGHQDKNSLYILGPNAEARQVVVDIHHQTLSVVQASNSQTKLKNVIVRIGMRDLTRLVYSNCGNVTGRDIRSSNLIIQSNGSGTVLLDGHMNVSNITQYGTGTVTVIGAYSPHVCLSAASNGNINVSGRVGVDEIHHSGNGTINVIGLDTNSLTIQAQANGLTALAGYANLKSITAQDNARVYLYWVDSNGLSIVQRNNANVGLAGITTNLNLDVGNSAYFDGQFLRSCTAYAQTYGWAHANVRASQKMFAFAADNSSIYFFGPPSILLAQTSGSGSVIPVGDETKLPPMIKKWRMKKVYK